MKILLFTNIIPFPLDEGGKVAQFVFVKQLVKQHEVVMVGAGRGDQAVQLEGLKERIKGLKTVLIEEKASLVTVGFFEKKLGIIHWELTKWLNRNRKQDRIIDNPFFIHPVQTRSSSFVHQWEAILAQEKPDLVQIDFIDNADLALLIPPPIKKVLVVHDLRFASVAQAAQINQFPEGYANYLQSYVKIAELAYINHFDGVVVFSEDDKQKVIPIVPQQKVFVVPFAVDDPKFLPLQTDFQLKKLVFIGPDHHSPNLDALEWYAAHLSQPVFERFGLELSVIGKWSKENRNKFIHNPHIHFLGFVNDLASEMKNAALIVPLRIGSGIRTKIIEAFAMGVPVIATTVGVEGLGVADRREFFLANDTITSLECIDILKQEIANVLEVCSNAKAFAKKCFSVEVNFTNRMNAYDAIYNANKLTN